MGNLCNYILNQSICRNCIRLVSNSI